MPKPYYIFQDFMNRTDDSLKVIAFYAMIAFCLGFGVASWR